MIPTDSSNKDEIIISNEIVELPELPDIIFSDEEITEAQNGTIGEAMKIIDKKCKKISVFFFNFQDTPGEIVDESSRLFSQADRSFTFNTLLRIYFLKKAIKMFYELNELTVPVGNAAYNICFKYLYVSNELDKDLKLFNVGMLVKAATSEDKISKNMSDLDKAISNLYVDSEKNNSPIICASKIIFNPNYNIDKKIPVRKQRKQTKYSAAKYLTIPQSKIYEQKINKKYYEDLIHGEIKIDTHYFI